MMIEIIICSIIEYTENGKLIILKKLYDLVIEKNLDINKAINKIKKQFWDGMKGDEEKNLKLFFLWEKLSDKWENIA